MLVMVPVRHVNMLVWESPEQVGIPEFRIKLPKVNPDKT